MAQQAVQEPSAAKAVEVRAEAEQHEAVMEAAGVQAALVALDTQTDHWVAQAAVAVLQHQDKPTLHG